MRHQLFATKSLRQLLDEMAGENRLRRVLGPVQLTSDDHQVIQHALANARD